MQNEHSSTVIRHSLPIAGVTDARLWGRGARGVVYRANFAGRDVAVKVKFRESRSTMALLREARALELVNSWRVGPTLRYADDTCVITDFVDGADIREWLPDARSTDVAATFENLLEQAYRLDFLGRSKGELHRLTNNLLITDDNRPVLLDFERLVPAERPQNVTQIVHYLVVRQPLFAELGICFDSNKAKASAVAYKRAPSRRRFRELLDALLAPDLVLPPAEARRRHGPRVARFRRRIPSRMKSHASNLETLRRIARAQH